MIALNGFGATVIDTGVDYVLYECPDDRFGGHGAILLVDYNKTVGTTEDGIYVQAEMKFYLNGKPAIDPNDLDWDVKNKTWILSETTKTGDAYTWTRNFNSTGQYSYPVPLPKAYTKLYLRFYYINDTSNITSTLKVHILNDN